MMSHLGKMCVLVAGLSLGAAACHPLTEIPPEWPPVFDDKPEVIVRLPEPGPPVKLRTRSVEKRPECMAVYAVTKERRLFAYHPLAKTFEERGQLDCPGAGFTTPFSMAVGSDGIAQVVYNDGRLYRVSVDDAHCEATDFKPNQDPGFRVFGMGYAPDGHGESLYVAQISFFAPSRGLGRIDTTTKQLSYIGPFSENPGVAIELTPTGKGPLYGYFINQPGPGGTLVEIDTKSGTILSSRQLNIGTGSPSLAVAWWGGDFYIFTTIVGGTAVNRYDPETGLQDIPATLPQTIVGAGVSTCAPGRDTPKQDLSLHPRAQR
jgi:hypothetical protein